DQTYADYDVGCQKQLTYRKSRSRSRSKSRSRILRCSLQRSKSSDASSSSYERTADFFENIPDFLGDSLPSFLYSPQEQQDVQPKGRERIKDEEECVESESTSDRSENCDEDDVLRLCEDFLCRHRMRPDFFCQYHKAVSSATPSPKQRKASPPVVPPTSSPGQAAGAEVKASKEPPKSSRISAVVERFTKFSAIYTLPVAKRKKTCNKTTGNITGGWRL
ncbi:hypothetical protein KR018_010616, partial [Drosophila ironensis]